MTLKALFSSSWIKRCPTSKNKIASTSRIRCSWRCSRKLWRSSIVSPRWSAFDLIISTSSKTSSWELFIFYRGNFLHRSPRPLGTSFLDCGRWTSSHRTSSVAHWPWWNMPRVRIFHQWFETALRSFRSDRIFHRIEFISFVSRQNCRCAGWTWSDHSVSWTDFFSLVDVCLLFCLDCPSWTARCSVDWNWCPVRINTWTNGYPSFWRSLKWHKKPFK